MRKRLIPLISLFTLLTILVYAVLYYNIHFPIRTIFAENRTNSKYQEIIINVNNRTIINVNNRTIINVNNRTERNKEDIMKTLKNAALTSMIVNNNKKENCKMEKLVGRSVVNLNNVKLDWLHENELPFVRQGGWYAPTECRERQSTAIIIPFRNREPHLPIFLRQLHPLLKRQQLHYRIFIIEQTDNSQFNRGKLINVGFNISRELFPYNCFVFHDVDLVPEDDRIDYGCKHSPTHLTVAIDVRGYKLTYAKYFGGAEMFTKADYEKVNGYSNSFWYWGGEDDNLLVRTKQNKMRIHRQPVDIARYTAIKHTPSKERLPIAEKEKFRFKSNPYNKKDGLNTLQYELMDVKEYPLYTHVKVNLRKERDRLYGVLHKFED